MAFKAATKRSGTIAHARLPSAKGAAPTPATAECLGADSLLQLLKNYVHATGAKVAVTVGVIGPPNVGKSSIINSLKRSKVAAVGNTPGVTTGVQEVHLDKHLRLVDSPGVVFSAAADAAEAALRNCVKVRLYCCTGARAERVFLVLCARRIRSRSGSGVSMVYC